MIFVFTDQPQTGTGLRPVPVSRVPNSRYLQEEANRLRFQNGTLKKGQNIKYLPYVFTEQGVAMLSSVLKSKRARQVNITIMRVFVRLKEFVSNYKDLANKLEKLEKRIDKKDEEVQAIFEAIRELMEPPPVKRKPKIGFR